jgi:hypothetical protein
MLTQDFDKDIDDFKPEIVSMLIKHNRLKLNYESALRKLVHCADLIRSNSKLSKLVGVNENKDFTHILLYCGKCTIDRISPHFYIKFSQFDPNPMTCIVCKSVASYGSAYLNEDTMNAVTCKMCNTVTFVSYNIFDSSNWYCPKCQHLVKGE